MIEMYLCISIRDTYLHIVKKRINTQVIKFSWTYSHIPLLNYSALWYKREPLVFTYYFIDINIKNIGNKHFLHTHTSPHHTHSLSLSLSLSFSLTTNTRPHMMISFHILWRNKERGERIKYLHILEYTLHINTANSPYHETHKVYSNTFLFKHHLLV